METEIHTKPRLAFAGVGWIGRHRMQSALNSGRAEVELITDTSEESLQEALKMAPGSRTATSFEAAVMDPEVDGIVIATPSALHKEQAVMAFENGKSVFCQKPLGRNAAEVEAVVHAAEKANRMLGADFSYRYTAAFQKILAIIRAGELGDIYAVDLKFHNAYGPDKPWFYEKKSAGGGCVLDLGIHLIDLMLYALNFPDVQNVNSQLFSKGKRLTDDHAVEDYAAVNLLLENETSVQLACSWNLPAGCEAVIEASFYGTQGGAGFRNVNGSFYDFVAQRYHGTQTEVLVQPPDNWGGRALLRWIEMLSDEPEFQEECRQYISSAKILDRIYGKENGLS